MTAASPGVIAQFMANRYYASHQEYIDALAEAMSHEYEAIAARRSGAPARLSGPGVVAGLRGQRNEQGGLPRHGQRAHRLRSTRPPPASLPESMRMHVCWGNYEGPHNHDIPLIEIIDRVLQARPAALLFEAANPRHEHEWAIFKEVSVPDGKILVPGVLDTTCNYIEHPELVAERIERIARLVGMERGHRRDRLRLRHIRSRRAGRSEDRLGQAWRPWSREPRSPPNGSATEPSPMTLRIGHRPDFPDI